MRARSGEIYRALEKYLVIHKDARTLKQFFQIMYNFIPQSFFEISSLTKVDYSTIAYNRYCDALLQNGVLERRIATVVMGLEALFLKKMKEEVQDTVLQLECVSYYIS